jgi:hypothetical protein
MGVVLSTRSENLWESPLSPSARAGVTSEPQSEVRLLGAIRGANHQGLRGGIYERKHRERMGSAIWLFGWLCSRQTKENGLVHGGKKFTYATIAEDMDESPRRVERWMWKLRDEGYVLVKHGLYKKLVIRILNQRKFPSRQKTFSSANPDFHKHQQTADIKTTSKRRIYKHQQTADMTTRNGGFNGEEREEESKNEEISPLSVFFKSAGVSPSLWKTFRTMREKIHRPVIAGAEEMLLQELIVLQGQGNDPVEVIQQAIVTSSFRFFPVSKNGGNRGHESFREREQRHSFAALAGVLPDGVSALAGGVQGDVSATPLSPIDRVLRGIAQRPRSRAAGCGVPARDEDLRVHANGGHDPEGAARTNGDGSAIDVHPVSRTES